MSGLFRTTIITEYINLSQTVNVIPLFNVTSAVCDITVAEQKLVNNRNAQKEHQF